MAFDTSNVSALGFGCMRFIGHEADEIDLEHTAGLIDRYLEAGGNYFDTAWAYPNSERALGAALVARHPRDSFLLASKCVAWTHCNEPADLERQLQDTLRDLGCGYLDVYLMHNLGGARTAAVERFGVWEFMKGVKTRGLARHIGFSAHCTPEELEGFLAAYPEAEVVQLQVNYADWENPSWRERECVDVCRRAGVPVIAMEPVKGGILADPPAAVRAVLDEELPQWSPAQAALRFAASRPGVACTLSGMSTPEMVEQNCRALLEAPPMGKDDDAAFERARDAMSADGSVPCTGCGYCTKVCPQDVGIPGSMNALNYLINTGDPYLANHQLGFVVFFNQGKKLPDACVGCGACEAACPQGIPILEHLERIKAEVMPFAPKLEQTMKPA